MKTFPGDQRSASSDRGIVRAARRPPGWQAPGPPPATPIGRPDLWPAAGEELCHLAGDWRILQLVRGHRWSLDDLVTAWFAARVVSGTAERVLDLGCGIGSVLLLLAWRLPRARLVGVEAQPGSVALARRSVAWNGVGSRCEVRHGDLRDPRTTPQGAIFDLVTGTPPYLPSGTATVPVRPLQAGCHLEQRGGVEDYCLAASRLLRPGGRLVLCHAAAARDRVARAAAAAGLDIARRLDVIPREGKSVLFSVFSIHRHGLEGRGPRLAALVVRDRDGQWTTAFRSLREEMGMPARN